MVERLKNFPRQPDMLVYGLRALAAVLVRLWLRIYHRYSARGLENLPADGSYVLIANHSSHLDVAAIVSSMPLGRLHHIFPAAARDYFFASAPRTVFSAVFVNALPFDRKANFRQSLGICDELLKTEGNVLVLFPEGTRSPDGKLRNFKPGIGLLLAGSPHPVVPCHLSGAHEALPKGSWLARPRRIRLTIGKPISFQDMEKTKESAQSICKQLHAAVEDLGRAV